MATVSDTLGHICMKWGKNMLKILSIKSWANIEERAKYDVIQARYPVESVPIEGADWRVLKIICAATKRDHRLSREIRRRQRRHRWGKYAACKAATLNMLAINCNKRAEWFEGAWNLAKIGIVFSPVGQILPTRRTHFLASNKHAFRREYLKKKMLSPKRFKSVSLALWKTKIFRWFGLLLRFHHCGFHALCSCLEKVVYTSQVPYRLSSCPRAARTDFA